jgi:hypothetical protein
MDSRKANDIIDYAMPLMVIERYAKEIHNMCLVYKYMDARLLTEKLCVEGRLLQHVLRVMDEQQNERRMHADSKEVSTRS